MIYLDHEEILYVAERALGQPPEVRDHGLIESAAARLDDVGKIAAVLRAGTAPRR